MDVHGLPNLCNRFNSRTREGCDVQMGDDYRTNGGFNSRTREGCDYDKRKTLSREVEFQFTHPGGVRLPLIVQGQRTT